MRARTVRTFLAGRASCYGSWARMRPGTQGSGGQSAKEQTMMEPWEKECATLRAELAALQQQISALAEQHASGAPATRRRASRRLGMIALPLLILTGAGALYGHAAIEALFVDARGNVGVGTTTPQGFQVALPESAKPAAP